jgi:hypothetical protein
LKLSRATVAYLRPPELDTDASPGHCLKGAVVHHRDSRFGLLSRAKRFKLMGLMHCSTGWLSLWLPGAKRNHQPDLVSERDPPRKGMLMGHLREN